MTRRQMTPAEIARIDAYVRQWWLSFLTLGIVPRPEPEPETELEIS